MATTTELKESQSGLDLTTTRKRKRRDLYSFKGGKNTEPIPPLSGIRLGFGKKSDSNATPKWLYDNLNKEFQFTFDPCPLEPTFNGLEVPWKESNFVNPPFSDIGAWVEKAVFEHFKKQGASGKSVFLIPFRPHTKYWRMVFQFASEVRILTEQIRFDGYDTKLPLTLCLVVFSQNPLCVEHQDEIRPSYVSLKTAL